MQAKFEFLNTDFLQLVEDVMRYGQEKYGSSALNPAKPPARRPDRERCTRSGLLQHASGHEALYARGVPHDHFGTREHQLAAAVANLMIEFALSRNEPSEK